MNPTQAKQTYDDAIRRIRDGDLLSARGALAQVSMSAPNAVEPLFHMGSVDLKLGRPRRALEVLRKAYALSPEQDAIRKLLANALAAVGEADEAISLHSARIKSQPDELAPWMDKAVVLQQFGRFDEAEELFQKLHPKAKTHGDFFRIWFASHKFSSSKDKALRDALALWKHPKLNDNGRLRLGFALAKAMESLKEYDRIFEFLKPANDLQAKIYPYDRQEREDRLTETIRTASEGEIARRGSAQERPVFLIGVPRSGTTLIENVLAAHPEVRAGGEIGQARQMAYLTLGPIGKLPNIADVDDGLLDTYAKRFWASADETATGDAPVITDKTMQNQSIMGFLAAAYPQARFIVVRREPRDVALSIYKNYFAPGSHRYSNRLEDIAHQLHTFEQAIEHWRNRVEMTEISYDALTADPEPITRDLVAAAGLEWDDSCLDHTKSKGKAVKTLSIAQVRKPIYKSSSGGWQRHETELKPFIEAWEAK